MALEVNQHVQIGTRRLRVLRHLAAPPIGLRVGRTDSTPAWIYLGAEPRPVRRRGLVYDLPFGTFIRLAQRAESWAAAEWYELALIAAAGGGKPDHGREVETMKRAG